VLSLKGKFILDVHMSDLPNSNRRWVASALCLVVTPAVGVSHPKANGVKTLNCQQFSNATPHSGVASYTDQMKVQKGLQFLSSFLCSC